MQRKEVLLDSCELTRDGATANARLRFKRNDGIVVGRGLTISAHLSDELHERIRFEIEKEIAASIGADVETFSKGTLAPAEFSEVD